MHDCPHCLFPIPHLIHYYKKCIYGSLDEMDRTWPWETCLFYEFILLVILVYLLWLLEMRNGSGWWWMGVGDGSGEPPDSMISKAGRRKKVCRAAMGDRGVLLLDVGERTGDLTPLVLLGNKWVGMWIGVKVSIFWDSGLIGVVSYPTTWS